MDSKARLLGKSNVIVTDCHRVMKFTIFRLLSLQMQYTNGEDYIGTVVFEMNLLMKNE